MMSTFLNIVGRTDVVDSDTFIRFAQQTLGTKLLPAKEMAGFNSKAREFFAQYPGATWMTLVRTVEYVRAKRKRLATPWQVFAWVPWAYKDGVVTELDPANHVLADPRVEGEIAFALEHETDPWWVSSLKFANGVDSRKAILSMWKMERANA